MDKPPLYTLVPQRRGVERWPVTSTTVRAIPLRQMEPRLGRMFHSSATGRRRGTIFPDQSRGRQALQEATDPLEVDRINVNAINGGGGWLGNAGRPDDVGLCGVGQR